MYIRRLTLNERHTLEDIEMFSKTINLFRFAQDNPSNDDIANPEKPRIVFMNVFDGFVALESFNQLLAQQQTTESEKIPHESGNSSHQDKIHALISPKFWELLDQAVKQLKDNRTYVIPHNMMREHVKINYNKAQKLLVNVNQNA